MTMSTEKPLDIQASQAKNRASKDDTLGCDVLVIGAGLAGLSTALSLPKHLQVVVLAKEALDICSSYYAQGGIAAVIDKEDSIDEHVSDTLIAGDGLCDVEATTQILAQGGDAIEWLLQHHVPFTTQNESQTKDGSSDDVNKIDKSELHLTREGGHSRRRVAHVDDATGRYIMQTLQQQALTATNITVLPYHEALRLNTESVTTANTQHTETLRCTGATVLRHNHNDNNSNENKSSEQLLTIHSHAVVLASGGLGQLFNRATAPHVCIGDGIMMAWEAGCRLANLEFIQFHPTGLFNEGTQDSRNFLISEAVRGEGGYLLDPITHTRFMPNYDERAELAPRDIVARAIATEIANNKLGYVHLDISHQPADFIKNHFPDIYSHCLSLGIDMTTDPIPVAPTAHYTCGGVVTTANGQTDIAGLYAAGEVAHTGLHGANRLASNSLLECVVVGRDIAAHIPHYFQDIADHKGSDLTKTQNWFANMESSTPSAHIVPEVQSFEVKPKLGSFKSSETTPLYQANYTLANQTRNSTSRSENISALKQLMTQNMGIRRDNEQLASAIAQVRMWQHQDFNATYLVQDHKSLIKGPTDECLPIDIFQMRYQRLLNLALLLLQSAQARLESRGGHYRHDYPVATDTPSISIIPPKSALKTATPATTPATNSNLSHHSDIPLDSSLKVLVS